MTQTRLALQWRLNKLKQLPPKKQYSTLYNWIISKAITQQDFIDIMTESSDKLYNHDKAEEQLKKDVSLFKETINFFSERATKLEKTLIKD
jgi:hypothetical protein